MAKHLVGTYSHKLEPRLVAATFSVKYRDIFHMKNLYKLVHEWVLENGWGPDKDLEKFYGQKTDQSKSSELWIWWEIGKKSKHASYYNYKMKIKFHVIGLGNKEVMHEGKKLKANTGECEVGVHAWIEFNENEWEKHKFLKHFPGIFRKRIFEANIEDHKRELYREAYNFQGTVKRYLNMKGFLSELDIEPFHPSYSWH